MTTLYVTLKLETADDTLGHLAPALDEVKRSLAARDVKATVFQVRSADRKVVLGARQV